MSACLLLLLLSSWSLLVAHSQQCETAVAFVDSVLSVPRSLMANADVALLKAYNATTVKNCLEDCCNGKYGACSVASFKKNTTTENCIHFNCRPLPKCKFLSSPSTNSFSFSSNPTSPKPVPFEHHPSSTPPVPPTPEREQFTLKNDNKTVKPRKGVEDDPLTNKNDPYSKSGIKPRKGVNFEDDSKSKFFSNKDQNRSNVKARKGVGPYSTTDLGSSSSSYSTSEVHPSPVVSDDPVTPTRHHYSTISDDLVADLAKILEDDSMVESSSSLMVPATTTPEVVQSSTLTTSFDVVTMTTTTTTTGVPLFASELTRYVPETTSSRTPQLQTSPVLRQTTTSAAAPETHSPVVTPTRRHPAVVVVAQTLNAEYSREDPEEVAGMDKLVSVEDEEEAENDRKYKSSIHLVLSLVFGLLVLFAVLGVVAKRVYDGWLRRDYYRMNYLIDGIYNGVD